MSKSSFDYNPCEALILGSDPRPFGAFTAIDLGRRTVSALPHALDLESVDFSNSAVVIDYKLGTEILASAKRAHLNDGPALVAYMVRAAQVRLLSST